MSAPAIRGLNERLDKVNETIQELVKEFKSYVRPRIIVQIRPSKTSVNILDFEIKNVGKTTAYDISCRFTPDIKYEKTDLLLSQLPVFNNLSLLAPKDGIVFFFASAIEYFNDKTKPMELETVITYRDDAGRKYEEKTVIKVNLLEKLMFIKEKSIDDIVDTLRRIERMLDKMEYSFRRK